ncbi:hypothetical protein KFL_000830060 [Klebsormidium nitens]|uniref:Uncharacterized protein n=1 Tax=Klebsormidium nitens TaxID=105231 RepID=A0A1Y1HSA9_KLENI|nr:hypothetical protein KFL_000830060 [Klebsormidium nitens]|eukprot:GAQ81524.1 hypothetical protein KFL_000830060 [Klebsormidium nitens]
MASGDDAFLACAGKPMIADRLCCVTDDGLPASVVRMLVGFERKASMAMERLGCSHEIQRILKHTWEAEMGAAVEDAAEQRAISVGREAGLQYEKSELQLAVLNTTKEAHLLRVRLESALDDLEEAEAQRQVLEAWVIEQEGTLAKERLERERMRQRWQVVREQAQQEQRARMQAQAERDDLATALREEKAARVQAEKAVQAGERELAALEKSHCALQQRAEDLQKELTSTQAAQTERLGGEHERVVQLEQQLAAAQGDLQKVEKERGAARKESGRLAKVVEEQGRELEVAEQEHAAQADAVQALKAELAALKASHATLSAENGDLRMLAGEAGATVPERRPARKSRESPTRNLGGAMEQAAPAPKRQKKAPGKAVKGALQSKAEKGGSNVAPEEEAGKAAHEAGAGKEREAKDMPAEPEKDDPERRFSPRLKRPISAESRQSGRPPLPCAGGAGQPLERDPKRAKLEQAAAPPANLGQGCEQAPRAPLQAVPTNTAPASSHVDVPKGLKPKRTLAPSASKVLMGLPPREPPKSLFGKAFKVPQLLKAKAQTGTTSQEVDQATLMSP